jgi:MtfA peptidase
MQQLQSHRERAAVSRRSIPDDLWKRTLVRYPFLQRKSAEDAAELRRLTSLLLDRKEFSAAGGLRLTDAMTVAIAAQAALPVLRLGVAAYDGFVGIVVHPDQVSARRQHQDDDGVVHEYNEVLAGEAMQGGPVMLSWPDVRASGLTGQGYNVVIHEFAHVLDMADGRADGVPLLPPGLAAKTWLGALQTELKAFVARVQAGEATLLDPYAAEGEEEFFAVTSEAFFTAAPAMKKEHPLWYGMLSNYYRQDPAEETAVNPRRN